MNIHQVILSSDLQSSMQYNMSQPSYFEAHGSSARNYIPADGEGPGT